MPKRTNSFQMQTYLYLRVVYPDARVTQSAMVWDAAAESDREVDILIERQRGDVEAIAYEVTAPSRLTSVQWLEQMIGKYGSIHVGDVNLISNAGFTKSARRKAQATDNISTVEIQPTEANHWNSDMGSTGWFERLKSELTCSVRYADRAGNEHIQRLEHDSIILLDGEEIRAIDVYLKLFGLAANNDDAYEAMKQENGKATHFRLTDDFSIWRFAALPDECEVVEFYVGLEPSFKRWPTSVRAGRLHDRAFAYLESVDRDNPIFLTLVETAPGVLKGSVAEPC